MQFIYDTANSVSTAAHVGHHAQIVREKSMRRNVMALIANTTGMLQDPQAEIEDILDCLEEKAMAVREAGGGMEARVTDNLERTHAEGLKGTGVMSGFAGLDKLTGGFQDTDLVVMAARPGMGKTSLALAIAINAAENNCPVGIFSLEMSADQLMQRMACMVGEIDSNRLRTATMGESDWQRFNRAADKISQLPLYIDDAVHLNTLELRAKARRMKRKYGIRLLIVDYLQLMTAPGRHEGRQVEVATISRSLKALAKELNVPILALSQLNREVEYRADQKPRLADLRESGALEQDADAVIMLHYPDEEKANATIAVSVLLKKNRNGPTGAVALNFHRAYTLFKNKSDRGEGHTAGQGFAPYED